MPTPKKTNSKTVAKEVPASKEKDLREVRLQDRCRPGGSRQEEMLEEKGV